jgi:hypothetical protein
VAGVGIRVLGAIEVLDGRRSVTLPVQEAKVLAMLVSAGYAGNAEAVPRPDLVDGLWRRAPAGDRLSPVLSRLRGRLKPLGITISTAAGRYGHRLESLEPGAPMPADLVDAHRFSARVTDGSALLARGAVDAAVDRFRAAAGEWGGAPFPVPDWHPPAGCRRAAERLDRLRTRLVREWALAAAQRGGERELLDRLAVTPALADGLERDDALRMLRFLAVLADGGAAAAERFLDAVGRDRYDRFTLTADRLLELHEHGVDVVAPVDTPTATGPGPAAPLVARLDPALGAALDALGELGDRAALAVTVETGADPAALLSELGRRATVRNVRFVCLHSAPGGGMAAWSALAGSLWAESLRLLPVTGAWPRAVERTMSDFLLTERAPAPGPLADALAALLRAIAARTPLLVAFDGAHRMRPGVDRLTRAVGERLGRAPVLLVLVHPEPADGTRTGTDWMAAAALTATGDEIDPALVARMLGLDDDAADRAMADAVAAGAVRAIDGMRFAAAAERDRVLAELELDPPRVRGLHARAFAALASRPGASPDGTATSVCRARHALGARGALDDDAVAGACLDAAGSLRATHQPGPALTLVDRALALASDPQLRFELLLLRGDAHHDRAEMTAAERAYLDAHAVPAVSPVQRGVAAVRLARRWSDPGRSDRDLLDLLERTRDVLDPGNPEAARLRLQLGAHIAHKTTMAVPESGERGVALARECLSALDDDRVRDDRGLEDRVSAAVACEVLTECRWALYDTARPAELINLAGRLDSAALAAESEHFRGEALVALTIDELRLGRVPLAGRSVERHRDLAAATGRTFSGWLRATMDTMLDLWHGEFAAAQARLLGESRELADRLTAASTCPADAITQTWMGQLFWLYREQGRMADLPEHDVPATVARRGYFPVWLAGMALLRAEVGDFGAAADQVAEVLVETDGLAALPPHGWAVPTLALLAETAEMLVTAGVELPGELDLTDLVRRLETRLVPLHGEIVLAGWPTVLLGPVTRFTGLLALARGDGTAAGARFAAAERTVGAAAPQRARLRFDQARALMLVGDQLRAAGLANRVHADALELGMPGLAAAAARIGL